MTTSGEQILEGLTDVADLIGKLAEAQGERDEELGRQLAVLAAGMGDLVDEVSRLTDHVSACITRLAETQAANSRIGVRKIPPSERRPN